MVPFVINLFVFGWTLGFVIVGFTIRFGPSFEILAWSIPVLLQPLSAVYYPVEILPGVLQKLAFFLPTMHLFEGMRSILLTESFSGEHILWATLLNMVYFPLGMLFFYHMLRVARKLGLLSRMLTD
jgi:ABC-2 type transport system permease protein